jgi:hypothetical protein
MKEINPLVLLAILDIHPMKLLLSITPDIAM